MRSTLTYRTTCAFCSTKLREAKIIPLSPLTIWVNKTEPNKYLTHYSLQRPQAAFNPPHEEIHLHTCSLKDSPWIFIFLLTTLLLVPWAEGLYNKHLASWQSLDPVCSAVELSPARMWPEPLLLTRATSQISILCANPQESTSPEMPGPHYICFNSPPRSFQSQKWKSQPEWGHINQHWSVLLWKLFTHGTPPQMDAEPLEHVLVWTQETLLPNFTPPPHSGSAQTDRAPEQQEGIAFSPHKTELVEGTWKHVWREYCSLSYSGKNFNHGCFVYGLGSPSGASLHAKKMVSEVMGLHHIDPNRKSSWNGQTKWVWTQSRS